MSVTGDDLLFAIAAAGPYTWRAFSVAFDSVSGFAGRTDADGQRARRRTHALLEALGYCEIQLANGTTRISAAPAVLARLPFTGLPKALLTGARQPNTIGTLERAMASVSSQISVDMEEVEMADAILPTRIEVEAETSAVLGELADLLRIPYMEKPPSWIIASQAAGLDRQRSRLSWQHEPPLDWRRRVFDTDAVRMVSADMPVEERLALISYEHPHSRKQRFELREGALSAGVDRSWGRYMVLASEARNVLRYDPRRNLLAAPAGAPLPRLLGRALTLASGRPPVSVAVRNLSWTGVGDWTVDIYDSVPPQIAETVATKVGQRLGPMPSNPLLRT